MTRRILFVDDDPMVLRGLQRCLFPMRSDWDMVFVESGAAALEAMAHQPFDAIVSDMRMPQMNGAELLNEVRRRHPSTARLVLSGHADKELILQCVASAHQFIAKPCEPEILKKALHHVLYQELDEEIRQCRVILARIPDLPVLPAHHETLRKMLDDPTVTLDALSDVVEGDIGLSARLLKLSNNAFFGLRRSVSTISEAIRLLGNETIKALVIQQGFMDQVPDRLPAGFDLSRLAANSLQVARLATSIAASFPAALPDLAFGAGLLHKAGLLMIAAAYPAELEAVFERAVAQSIPSWHLEHEAFGLNHAQLGAFLIGLWGLPDAMAQAVRHHLVPTGTPPIPSAATALHGACAGLSGKAGFDHPMWRLSFDHAHLNQLELRVPYLQWAELFSGQESE